LRGFIIFDAPEKDGPYGMAIVTLLTDWGTRDHFVAALKGELLSQVPSVQVVDITHHVKPHDIIEGAFIFGNAWHHFPQGTVHIVGMIGHSQPSPLTIAMKHQGHYFIGCNDGMFPLAFQEEVSQCYYLLTSSGEPVYPSLQVLADSAAFLAGGGNITDMGRPVDNLVKKTLFQPFTEEDSIRGVVTYIDSFGNAVTNISKSLFEAQQGDRKFEIHLRTSEYTVQKISSEYWEAGPGNLLVRFNDQGYLEIAICEANVSKLLNMKYGNPVRVDFFK
jgi:S-adenosylmethionine hydrolase